jgi:hypothetical protein
MIQIIQRLPAIGIEIPKGVIEIEKEMPVFHYAM